jgi:hypothetical protein
MNHFKIGGKVVCVIAGPWYRLSDLRQPSTNGPALDQVYTIAGFRDCGLYGFGLILEEIGHGDSDGIPWSYDARCFRPVIDRATDISALTALLDPASRNAYPKSTPGDRVRKVPVVQE